MPGTYTVRLTAGGRTHDQPLQVVEDPRIQVSTADRKAWTDAQMAIADLYRGAATLTERLDRDTTPAAADVRRMARELRTRLLTLYRDVGRSTAKPTADQQAQMQFLRAQLESLRRRSAFAP